MAKCKRCPNEAGPYYSCEECRKAKAAYQAKRREAYRAQGLCIQCGGRTNGGRKHCDKHLKYHRERMNPMGLDK